MAKNRLKALLKPYRIVEGTGFRLKDIDPTDTGGLGSEMKQEARDRLQSGLAQLSAFQEKLYAQGR